MIGKFTKIALFLICFNLSITIWNEIGAFPQVQMQNESNLTMGLGEVSETESMGEGITSDLGFFATVALIKESFARFINIFKNISWGAADFINAVFWNKLPSSLVNAMKILISMVYVMALIEFFGGRKVG